MACDLPASPPIREVGKRDLIVLDRFVMVMEREVESGLETGKMRKCL
jgi:hypothetical protein